MALDRIVSIVLRLAELVFACIVAGINGDYLHKADKADASSWEVGRFIYAEVVAGISIFLAIVWLVPFSGTFIHWPVDFIISVCWFAAFGLLVDQIGDSCGNVFNWNDLGVSRHATPCGQFKAIIAFAFLSAICWLASALVGILWVSKRERKVATADAAYARRRWYRRRV